MLKRDFEILRRNCEDKTYVDELDRDFCAEEPIALQLIECLKIKLNNI